MRRGRLSFVSILMLLLCAAALIGLAVFFSSVGGDSPAAAMDLREIVQTVGQVILQPRLPSTAVPGESERAPGLPTQEATQAPLPTELRKPAGLSLTIGGVARFPGDVTASQSFQEGGQTILAALEPRLHSDINILALDQMPVGEDGAPRAGLMPRRVLDLLREVGFDSVAVAGGSALDAGYGAAQEGLAAMQRQGFRTLGFGQGGLSTFKLNGLTIAWLHASGALSQQGAQAASQRERDQLFYPFDWDKLTQQAASLKQTHDLVVVSLHWPTSAGAAPSADQGTLARRLGQAGADMILGLGGERAQRLELYRLPDGQGGEREILIAYCLGNLLSENRSRREAQSGALLHLALTFDPQRRSVRYDSLSYSPTYVRRYTMSGGVYFEVLLSAEQPPENMSKAQRDQMAQSLRIIQEAFSGSPARLQR